MNIRLLIPILFSIALTILLSSCSVETEEKLNDIGTTLTDHISNVVDQVNPHVLSVKNGYMTNRPNLLIGDTFSNFFASPTWTNFKAESGENIVEFTGYMMYEETRVKARLQFIVQEDGAFEIGALSFNEVPQNEFVTLMVFNAIFEEDSIGVESETIETNAVDHVDVIDVVKSNDFEMPDSIYEGGIEGIPLKLGDDGNQIIEFMGEPESMDIWGGSYYFMYPTVTFFTDSTDPDDYGTITMIGLPQGVSLLGITIGQTFNEIQQVLGENHVVFSELDEEWEMAYDLGDYSLVFTAIDEDGPTNSIEYYVN